MAKHQMTLTKEHFIKLFMTARLGKCSDETFDEAIQRDPSDNRVSNTLTKITSQDVYHMKV